MPILFLIFIIGFLFLQNAWTAPATSADTVHLKQIQNQIKNIQNNLLQDNEKKVRIQKDLQQTETRMGQLSTQLEQTQRKLAFDQRNLKSLMRQQTLYQHNLEEQYRRLSNQLRAAYMLGQQDYLKVLLNQNNASQMRRMGVYYHYLIKNRMEDIQDIQSTLTALATNQDEIKNQSHTLLQLQTQLQDYTAQLESTKKNRAQVLTELKSQMQNKQERLHLLIANKEALENVLNQLETRKTASQTTSTLFEKTNGKLAWPTAGQIIQNYGSSIEQSELKSNGVLISAPEGQPVYAIASGKVVYANWMAGYGSLIIIDHGRGLMSIYGQNAILYKKEGDTVHARDVIARVGKTGGYSQPGLYFAIRHQGKPVNPSIWCG